MTKQIKLTPPSAAYTSPAAFAVTLEHEQVICASGGASLGTMDADEVYDEDF